MKIKGVLFRNHGKAEIKEIEKSLEAEHELLGCDCIDIVERKIGDHFYDILCDDEGLYREGNCVTALNDDGEPMLVGNIFVVKFDGVEDITSLDDDDITEVLSAVRYAFDKNGLWEVLCCEF